MPRARPVRERLRDSAQQMRGLLRIQHQFLLFGAVYAFACLGTWYSAKLLETIGGVSLWYLPGDLRFFCIFAFGWVGFSLEVLTLLLLLLLQLTLAPAVHTPVLEHVLGGAYNLLAFPISYAAVIIPLRRKLGPSLDFARPAHSALFIASALFANALAATAGTAYLVFMGVIKSGQWMAVFMNWLTGDFIGIITLASLLLVLLLPRLNHFIQHGQWSHAHRAQRLASDRRAVQIGSALVLAGLLLLLGISGLTGIRQASPLFALLLLLPLAAVALRSKLSTTLIAIVLLETGLVLSVAASGQRDMAMQYQLVMVAIALVGLWLGGSAEARHRLFLRLQDFSNASHDLLWETDVQGRLHISEIAEKIHAPYSESWRTRLEPVLQRRLLQLAAASAPGQAFSGMELALHGDGETPRWISISGIPLWDEVGACAGYQGTATDISDRVRTNSLLEGYNQRLMEDVAQRTHRMLGGAGHGAAHA